jgi:hypothetical protein
MKVKVVCPICHEGLEYEHNSTDGIAYGTIPIWDVACAEITINEYPGSAVRDHIDAHRKDGSYMEALEKVMVYEQTRADNYFERKANSVGA